jgi:hypothetical protein
VAPSTAIVVEDALAGGPAGRRGGFGLVIGVARSAAPADLRTDSSAPSLRRAAAAGAGNAGPARGRRRRDRAAARGVSEPRASNGAGSSGRLHVLRSGVA